MQTEAATRWMFTKKEGQVLVLKKKTRTFKLTTQIDRGKSVTACEAVVYMPSS